MKGEEADNLAIAGQTIWLLIKIIITIALLSAKCQPLLSQLKKLFGNTPETSPFAIHGDFCNSMLFADDNGIEIFETIANGLRFHTLSDIIESFVPSYVDDEQIQKGFYSALRTINLRDNLSFFMICSIMPLVCKASTLC